MNTCLSLSLDHAIVSAPAHKGMLNTEQLLPVIETSLGKLLQGLSVRSKTIPTAFVDQYSHYKFLKSSVGRSMLGTGLKLTEHEFSLFDRCLQDVHHRLFEREDDTQRDTIIAQLRLIGWLETIAQWRSDLNFLEEFDSLVAEEIGYKRIRALELIVRNLIDEQHDSQQALVEGLSELFSPDVVAEWLRKSDQGDVLSGTTFGELASIFINPGEFSRHQPLFEAAPFLTFLVDHRRTIQAFLEDVRHIRNTLVHNKKVTHTQLALLDLYYEELIAPIQHSFDEGRTAVNPQLFLEVSSEELGAYFEDLREDIQAVREDVAEFRAEVTRSLEQVSSDTADTRRTVKRVDRRLAWLAGAIIAVLGIGTTFLLMQGQDRVEEVKKFQKTTSDTIGEVKEVRRDVKNTLAEIRKRFTIIDNADHLVAKPERPEHFYHNARIYEQRGDHRQARKNYERFFEQDLDLIDPHLRFLSIIKLQDGQAGARAFYVKLAERFAGNKAMHLALALVHEPETRIGQLETVTQRWPEYAPGWYQLGMEYSRQRLGSQGLADKRREKELLEKFLELAATGHLLQHFLDQQVAASQLDDAKQRQQVLAAINPATFKNPVHLIAQRSNLGWMLYLQINDPGHIREIFYRMPPKTDFQSLGVSEARNLTTGRHQPIHTLSLSGQAPAARIHVKYSDFRNREHGPYVVEFDPERELVTAGRRILKQLPRAWATFRDFDGKTLVYFTHLLSYRSAIKEVRYAIDNEKPTTLFPLPPTDPKNPLEIPSGAKIFFEVPRDTRFLTVQLKYRDGTTSKVQRFVR